MENQKNIHNELENEINIEKWFYIELVKLEKLKIEIKALDSIKNNHRG